MAATVMDGKALAARIRARVADDVGALGEIGLATVLVGDDPASDVYIRLKHTAALEVGIRPVDKRLPVDTTEGELLGLIDELNADESIHAVLVQTPLPRQIDEIRVTDAVDPLKDVDGFNPTNAGRLYRGRPSIVPATAVGVMALLDEYGIPLEGSRAVIVGRSDRVGKPLIHLLMQRNATVTMCHSYTRELGRHTLEADVLVVATGHAGLVSPDMVKRGATVIDVGLSRTDAGLVGDVDVGVAEIAAYFTPIPGGVGPMTIACLLENAVRCARLRRAL